MTYAEPRVDEADLFAQVRRFTVHDDTHGGYTAVIIGYWDKLGYSRCLDHAPEPDMALDVIECNNSAVEGDRCDTCGVSILAAALKRRDRRGLFPSTCTGTSAWQPID